MQARIQRQPSLADQVYEALCASIISGELKSGDRLIFEQLAPKLGVSQTPIREAVIRLVQNGIATEDQGGKLQVVPLTEEYVMDIFLVRGALEGLAAELATPHICDHDLDELRASLEHADNGLANGNIGAYGEGGGLLHERVIERAGNPALASELRSLRIHVRYIISYSQRHVGDHLERSQREHWLVLDALASRDSALAREVLESHIRNSGARIAKLIEFDRTQSNEGGLGSPPEFE